MAITPKTSFLFIPDISGFTAFVNRTEVDHSRHIISELLELIIDSDQLGMEVSEVEGDAILFYKVHDAPSLDAIVAQVRETFLRFHNHLKRYERDRICNCGACSTASGLTLKFVVHTGEMEFIKVKNRYKLYGPSVILAHRLLKNEVNAREYLLLTEDLLQQNLQAVQAQHPWVEFANGHSRYDEYGDVPYVYALLSPLHREVALPEQVPPLPKSKQPIALEETIHAPPDQVFELLTNFEYRHLWNTSFRGIEYEKNRVNRVGTRHTCVFDRNSVEIETVTNSFGESRMVYGERTSQQFLLRELVVYFILEPYAGHTRLTVEVHVKPLPLIGWLVNPMLKRNFIRNMSAVVALIKSVAEDGRFGGQSKAS